MRSRPGRGLTVIAALLWLVSVAGYVYALIVHTSLDDVGREDLATDGSEAVIYGAALFSAATVGLVIAVRQSRHPVGWLFLGLGVALSVGAAGDAYALDRGVVDGDTSITAGLALVAGQASFIAWFGLLAVVLHLTPTGRPLSWRWALAMKATAATAVAALLARAVQDTAFDPPYDELRNPWALPGLAGPVDAVAGLGIVLTMLGLVVAAVSLVVRFRRAEGLERQQLRWMAVIAVALPPLVVTSFVASQNDLPVVRTVATGGFVALLPIAAGLSVLRYRLYDVDRIFSKATGYVLSSVLLACLFGAVVVIVGLSLGRFVDDSVLPAVVATVVTVSAAAPLHRQLQDVIDQRFDRRRYEARRLVRDHVRTPVPTRGLEATLAAALGDPTLTVAYWITARNQWVTSAGQQATIDTGDIEVTRDAEPVARIRARPAVVDFRLAHELAAEALPELDNIRLRAEIALQLEEVRDSRARIVAAQAAERIRIERNLHDGAQQRLLALALHLRAAELQGVVEHTEFDHAVSELGAAVRELRDLANGLHPTVLADGGLVAALDDLAGRTPLAIELDVPDTRFAPAVEEALWFVACEAVANTVKHASARALRISLTTEGGTARLICADDGAGGADPTGTGIRGITDRAEAAGGSVRIHSSAETGTTIEAVLPCAS